MVDNGRKTTMEERRERRRSYLPILSVRSFLIFTFVLSVLALAWWAFFSWYENIVLEEERHVVEARISPYEEGMTIQLNKRLSRLEGLTAFTKTQPSLDNISQEFNAFCAGLLSGNPGVRQVSIAPGGVVKYAYPLKGNEAIIGRNLLNDPRPDVRRDVNEIVERKTVALKGPYDLVVGGKGFIVREPIFNSDGSLRALAAMIFGIDQLIIDSGFIKLPEDIQVSIRDARGKLVYGSEKVVLKNPVARTIEVPGGNWKIEAIPKIGWEATIDKLLLTNKIVGAAIAVLLALLIAGGIDRQFLLDKRIVKATGDLAEANKDLMQLNRLYSMITSITEAIVHVTNEETLFDEVCRIAVDVGEFKMCWIGMIDETEKSVAPAAIAGAVDGYLDETRIPLKDVPEGREITGIAIRENRNVTLSDMANDQPTGPWRDKALARGYRSGGAFPIRSDNIAIGALSVYDSKTGVFKSEEAALLEEISVDISFALEKMKQQRDLEKAASFPRVNPSPIIEFHSSGLVLYHNEAAVKILERAGAPDRFELFKPDDMDTIISIFVNNQSITSQYREVGVGERLFGETIIYSGEDDSIRIYTLDITDKKKFEEELLLRRDELEDSYSKISKTLDDTVKAIAVLAEHKDPYTSGHERKVVDLAVSIGIEMGLDQNIIEGLRVASMLHDIGKTYIPAEILSKPGKLTDLEFDMIKVHPQYSYEVLSQIEFPWPVADIALQHHERVDGSGYPSGLKGADILLEARVLAVADVLEAMTNHRPYRPALDVSEATDEIKKNKDILYDKKVVAAALKVLKRGFEF